MKIIKYLVSILIVLTGIISAVLYYLNNYAYGRAGLYKHLYYKRYYWEMGILGNKTLILHIALLVSLIFTGVYIIIKSKGIEGKIAGIAIICISTAMIILRTLKSLQEMLLIYPYGLMVYALITAIFIVLGFIDITVNKRNS